MADVTGRLAARVWYATRTGIEAHLRSIERQGSFLSIKECAGIVRTEYKEGHENPPSVPRIMEHLSRTDPEMGKDFGEYQTEAFALGYFFERHLAKLYNGSSKRKIQSHRTSSNSFEGIPGHTMNLRACVPYGRGPFSILHFFPKQQLLGSPANIPEFKGQQKDEILRKLFDKPTRWGYRGLKWQGITAQKLLEDL